MTGANTRDDDEDRRRRREYAPILHGRIYQWIQSENDDRLVLIGD